MRIFEIFIAIVLSGVLIGAVMMDDPIDYHEVRKINCQEFGNCEDR